MGFFGWFKAEIVDTRWDITTERHITDIEVAGYDPLQHQNLYEATTQKGETVYGRGTCVENAKWYYPKGDQE